MKRPIIHLLQMQIVLLAGFTTALLSACSDEGEWASIRPAGEKETVKVIVPNPVTRAYIEDDEGGEEAGQTMSIQWSDGDRFVLVATDNNGETYPQITFTHTERADGWSGHIFAADMQLLPKENSYTYRAIYPVPESPIDNNKAYYTIPAVQNGEYDGSVKDLMWATTTDSQPWLKPQIYNPLNFRFKHLLHALKITIPVSPFGESSPIESIHISFPQAVTGRLSVDMTTGAAALEDDGTQGNGVTVRFDEPKAAGEAFWVFLAPSDAVNGEVQFMATDGTDYTWPLSTAAFRNLSAGYITPVRLGGLEIRPQSEYRVRVADYSQLGEQITDITSMVLPEGYIFPGPDMSRTAEHLAYTGDEGTFSVPMYDDIIEKLAENRPTVDFVLESAHAENLTAVSTGITAEECTLVAPYLFFEDFSSVETFHNEDEWSNSAGTTNTFSYGPFLGGWTGGRIGGMAGVAIRIACRRQTALTNHSARVDSPQMTHLKEGASVKVTVLYDYGMDRWGSKGLFGTSNGRDGGENYYQRVYLGYVKDADNTIYNAGNSTISEVTNFQLNELAASGDQLAGYYEIPHKNASFEIPDCDNITRLTWRTVPQSGGGGNNNTFWLYIDNVRVTIVP